MSRYLLLVFCLLIISLYAYAGPPTDNFLNTNVFYAFLPTLGKAAATFGVTEQLRSIAIHSEARYEAWCAYHPTALGKYLGNRIKRPSSEHTIQNKNIAIAYAIHRVIQDLTPKFSMESASIMLSLGLDPDNLSLSLNTPIGVGNRASRKVLAVRHNDGANQLGDVDGTVYHRFNYSDYTNYQPYNTDISLNDPDKWQPLMYGDIKGRPVVQKFLGVQLRYLKTMVVNISSASVPDQIDRYSDNRANYRGKVNEVLKVQRELNDYRKILSEFYDNKLASFNFFSDYFIGKFGNYHIDYHVKHHMVVNGVIAEVLGAVWKLKHKYDSVRPFSAIHFLKKDKQIRAWGGPGKGVVTMNGAEWKSYLPTDAFPDYPSGTSCVCASWMEAARMMINNSTFSYERFVPAGSSTIEPGVVPAQSFNISYTNLDDMMNECTLSRIWGGVHFLPAITESRKLCIPYGKQFYDKITRMISGNNA